MNKTLILALLTLFCAGAMAQTDDYQYMKIVSTSSSRTLQLNKVQKITFSDENAIVTVTDANAVQFPLTSLKKFTFTVSVNADVNGDGSVDIADVNAVLAVMFGSTEHTSEADVNGDCVVDIADVNAVLDAMFGD